MPPKHKHQALSSSLFNARQVKADGAKPGSGAHAGRSLPPIQEEPANSLAQQKNPARDVDLDDDSPLSKFKDWQAVKTLAIKQSGPSPALPSGPEMPGVKPPLRTAALGPAAAGILLLVQTLLDRAAAAGLDASDSGAASTEPPAGGLTSCLQALSDPGILALATDNVLTQLVGALNPLLRRCSSTRQWEVAGVPGILGPLQLACQERLSRTTLPCDSNLASCAGRLFTRIIREAGSGSVRDDLLIASAAYVSSNCRLLNSEALANLLSLLLTARFQPPNPMHFGSQCVQRLLSLSRNTKLHLCHFITVVEALAQLKCCDELSACSVVNLAAGLARDLEGEARQLDASQLRQLARVMNCVAVIAATTEVPSEILMATTAIWHLLTVRASALSEESAGSVAPALSQMWSASRMLMAVVQTKASESPSFQLPDRLGLMSHAAWLDCEQRVEGGLTSAQRRVLGALAALKVSPAKVTVNLDFMELFSISIAVRIQLQRTDAKRQIAILIRDPLKHLLHNSRLGATLGAGAAEEHLLQAAGWYTVPLDSQTCLQLPTDTLATELAALMIGDKKCSSLSCVA